MAQKVLAPVVGESITEVSIISWAKPDGAYVKSGELLMEIESDKASVEVVAEVSGRLKIIKAAGETVPVGSQVGEIDESATAEAGSVSAAPAKTVATSSAASPGVTGPSASTSKKEELSPAVRKMVAESGVNPAQINGSGKDGRLTKGDVQAHLEGGATAPATYQYEAPAKVVAPARDGERRVPMSRLRSRIAERLVMAQHTAAILTTFNEADMGPVMEMRKKYKDSFKAKYGVGLGFMSFFTRACALALKELPQVNAFIEGQDIVYHDFVNMGIAVGTEKGLVVPVLKNAETLSMVQIELELAAMAVKARDGKLAIADMSGGTFTISNGGVYGSLMSTPILNPPQSGILGMHKIQERPMAVNGQVVIRPMMYLAMSYDHRIIDGKEAVTFLVKVKEYLEEPMKMNPEFVREL